MRVDLLHGKMIPTTSYSHSVTEVSKLCRNGVTRHEKTSTTSRELAHFFDPYPTKLDHDEGFELEMLIAALGGIPPVSYTPTRIWNTRTLPSRAPSSSSWFLSSSISLPPTGWEYLGERDLVCPYRSSILVCSATSAPSNQLSIRYGSSSSLQLSLASEQDSTASSNTKADKSSSVAAGITRALLGLLAFFFRAPVRLFRPVKSASYSSSR